MLQDPLLRTVEEIGEMTRLNPPQEILERDAEQSSPELFQGRTVQRIASADKLHFVDVKEFAQVARPKCALRSQKCGGAVVTTLTSGRLTIPDSAGIECRTFFSGRTCAVFFF